MQTASDVMYLHSQAEIGQTEGGSCEKQGDFFITFIQDRREIKQVFEIGFNGGLSSAFFLAARGDVHVVSIDIGDHDYVLKAKKWIDKMWPGRHTLIIGDSTRALPHFMEQFPSYKPDLIFMDGGHSGDVPKKDLANCMKLARPDTWIAIDDVCPWMGDILAALDEQMRAKRLVVFEHEKFDIHSWVVCKKICGPADV
jgi:predicted O-methyltransferase YrrM